MSITEIKTEIAQLPVPKLAELAQWLEELHADAWDRQIERDVKAGRFEAIFKRKRAQQKSARGRSRKAQEGAASSAPTSYVRIVMRQKRNNALRLYFTT